jgi:hypothetical protein
MNNAYNLLQNRTGKNSLDPIMHYLLDPTGVTITQLIEIADVVASTPLEKTLLAALKDTITNLDIAEACIARMQNGGVA